MDLSREDEYFEWVDRTDLVDVAPRIIRQPEISTLRIVCMEENNDDDEIEFPMYDDIKWDDNNDDQVPKEEYDAQVEYYLQSPSLQPTYLEDDVSLCSTPTSLSPSDQSPTSELSELSEVSEPCDITQTVDDIELQIKPSHQVDYLAHDWPEEDLWASWKYIQSHRTAYENGRRLENASWRTWAKKRSNLKTIEPSTVGWEKDHDTTWLYGPLHKQPSWKSLTASPLGSGRPKLMRSLSYADVDVKSILKQRRMCDILLKRPSSAISVSMESSMTSLTSGRSSPSSTSSRKCVRFNDEVEQFIAVNTSHGNGGVIRYAMGGSTVEEDISVSTGTRIQPCLKASMRLVAKLPNSTLKSVDGIHSLSAAVQSLQDSLKNDHFVLPRFEYEEYASAANGDDDEWELSMIGMDFKTPTNSMLVGRVY
ncbi:7a719cf8-a3ba-4979-bf91-ac2bbe77ce52 [Sclerotinia trifoliorum]|uniref:7a719cf8-a3ba-4979-bf91-ac2bbe77ce52 n=1 Tax=Sclerotinia trifoliorum TaxID=28548 RepID=A0A8H2W637_9HELO|nr:7a719cf8-a3ba-4979-bf91-ac2bbe77ce52 [Sclerotinia trifoliorum]